MQKMTGIFCVPEGKLFEGKNSIYLSNPEDLTIATPVLHEVQ